VNSYRAFYIASLVLPIVITGCGGGSGFDPNKVTVTVSPATITIPASGQVTLEATVKGAPIDAVSSWTVAELKTNGASGAQCNWVGATPPAGPCPDGMIQGASTPPALTVTYDAPSTSGTFHVIAEWSTTFNPIIVKDATSVVTVSP
jgi:hypothetical protein